MCPLSAVPCRFFAFSLTILSLAASCGGGSGDNYPVHAPTQRQSSTLGHGDRLEVRVYYGSKQMVHEYTVGANGTISLPFIGLIRAAGLEPHELEEKIRARYADGYFKNPVVSVDLKESRSKKLSVFGQVKKPGTLAFFVGMTIVDAISQAGGFTPLAQKDSVKVTRQKGATKKKYTIPVASIGEEGASNFQVQPGDIIFVPQRRW